MRARSAPLEPHLREPNAHVSRPSRSSRVPIRR
jgi:hypothetical protein